MKQNLLFIGPVHSRSGYGEHARDLLDSLIEMDLHNIKVLSINWGMTPNNVMVESHSKLLLDRNERTAFDMSVQVTVPSEFKKLTKFDIGITAGIETTAASIEWINGLNVVDLVLVPSEFSKEVFINTKYTNKEKQQELSVTKPIEVLFEGAKDYYKHGSVKDVNLKHSINNINEDFVFLFVGHWLSGGLGEDRKNIGLMIKLFLETFKNTPSSLMPALLLKTGTNFSNPEIASTREKIESIISMVKRHGHPDDKYPNIYVVFSDFTNEQMNDLYNHPKIKAMLSFTKGEGFGRPLLEFSCVGKPIIASDWSGHLDFLSKENCILVPGKLKNIDAAAVWDKVLIKESSWFNVNPSMAASAMMVLFKNYKVYKEKAQTLAKLNKDKFSFNKMKLDFMNILDKYVPKQETLKLPKLNKITLPKLNEVNKNV